MHDPEAPPSGGPGASPSGGGDGVDVVGRRIGAALLDVLVLAILFVVMGLLFGESKSEGGEASVNLEGAGALAYFALVLLYYFVLEATTGQTIGKRLLGVRVVTVAGGPARPGPVALRTVLRVVDALPFLYLVGLIVILATGSRRQRVGDLAAGTTVVPA